MAGADLFARTQPAEEEAWHDPDPGGMVERSITAQKSTLPSTLATKGKWGNKDIQNALFAWILKACDDDRHYFVEFTPL